MPIGRSGFLYGRRKLLEQACRMLVVQNQGDGAWPTSPRGPLCNGRNSRYVVSRVVGALDREGEWMVGESLLQLAQPRDGLLVQRACRNAVDGFRGHCNKLALHQRLDGAVYSITRTIRIPDIDNYW